MRIGWGYDIHPLKTGRKLVLGGIEIPFDRGLSGHSDADVLIHAICDAILGAIGAGDLGRLFPDTDPRYSGIYSGHLLREVIHRARIKGYIVHNIDACIIAQNPRLAKYFPEMGEKLTELIEIEKNQINIKATSPEGIGAIGREEAIAAQCVVLMERTDQSPDSV
jgi:2-C-methyl-D-erythritol 2,4-cyclodiphosphate synthase